MIDAYVPVTVDELQRFIDCIDEKSLNQHYKKNWEMFHNFQDLLRNMKNLESNTAYISNADFQWLISV